MAALVAVRGGRRMALLERISLPVAVYPRTLGSTADGDVGQQTTEGAPVTLRGYWTPSDNVNEAGVSGQGYDNSSRITLRELSGVDPKTLRHARYVIFGRTYFATGEPEHFDALRNCRHWTIRLTEVGPSA